MKIPNLRFSYYKLAVLMFTLGLVFPIVILPTIDIIASFNFTLGFVVGFGTHVLPLLLEEQREVVVEKEPKRTPGFR